MEKSWYYYVINIVNFEFEFLLQKLRSAPLKRGRLYQAAVTLQASDLQSASNDLITGESLSGRRWFDSLIRQM